MSTTWDARELQVVGLRFWTRETRDLCSIDVNDRIKISLRGAEKGEVPQVWTPPRDQLVRHREGSFFPSRELFQACGAPNGQVAVVPRYHEAFGMSLLSFKKDLATTGGELSSARPVLNVGRVIRADSRVPVVKIVVGSETAAE